MHGHVGLSALERLEKVMVENGVALVVNLSGGDAENAWMSNEVAKAFPRLVPFFNVDWTRRLVSGFGAQTAKDLEQAVKTFGFKGLKVQKSLGLTLLDPAGARIPVDWPELDPLWAKAGELGVPVAIHTADPKAFWSAPNADNERFDELSVHPEWSFFGPEWPPREQLLDELERVIAKHPKTTFISVHFGNDAEDLGYVDRLLDRHPNLMIDTAARLGEIGRHPAGEVRAFFVKHRKRIVFGTDLGLTKRMIMLGSVGRENPKMADVKPFFDAHWRFFEGREKGIAHPTPIQGRWTIDAIDLPDDVLEDLYFRNALRVLKLDESALRR